MSMTPTQRRWFNQFFVTVAERGRDLLARGLSATEADPLALCHELISLRGEAAGRAIAREIVTRYGAMDDTARQRFFAALRDEFGADPQAIQHAATAYGTDQNDANLAALQAAVEPPRQELFRRLNMAPEGTAAIVAMRSQLLRAMKQDPALACVDADLRHLLASWFNPGFLELRKIDWWTSAEILEKLIAYESVHKIRDWNDLRRRLASDRRCFAFFHPALPDEPLIFVEVALARSVARNIHDILDAPLDTAVAEHADTAIFYSINNCQTGLRGISFGNFLIKQVVVELQSELPAMQTFATLSPVPGLMRWLTTEGRDIAISVLGEHFAALEQLASSSDSPQPDMWSHELRTPLSALCAHYLLHAKRDGQPADPVCRFHIGNGAELGAINWRADLSRDGLRRSAGMMVNYVYRLDAIERNHEAFATAGHIAAASDIVAMASRHVRAAPSSGDEIRVSG